MEGLLGAAIDRLGHLGGWLANSGYTLLAQATGGGTGGSVIGGGTTIGGGSTIERITLGGSQAPLDLSIWGMFMHADVIVKVVIVMLILASFWSWAIIFEKMIQIRGVNRRSNKFEDAFWSGGSLDELHDRAGQNAADPMSSIFASAMREWKRVPAERQRSTAQNVTLQERVERVMHVTLSREMERLERWLGFLASVGATAPFVGLFGTVWGIMNSFTAIAVQKSTNLSVVAPGIAEALLATALGLVAAIPAVVGFNKLSSDLGRYGNRLDGFVGEFGAIMSRQIEEKEH